MIRIWYRGHFPNCKNAVFTDTWTDVIKKNNKNPRCIRYDTHVTSTNMQQTRMWNSRVRILRMESGTGTIHCLQRSPCTTSRFHLLLEWKWGGRNCLSHRVMTSSKIVQKSCFAEVTTCAKNVLAETEIEANRMRCK